MAQENMRAKYETLSSSVLRDLAKARKIPRISRLKKAELIEVMLKQDVLDREKEEQKEGKTEETSGQPEKKPVRRRKRAAADSAGEEKENGPKETKENSKTTEGKTAGRTGRPRKTEKNSRTEKNAKKAGKERHVSRPEREERGEKAESIKEHTLTPEERHATEQAKKDEKVQEEIAQYHDARETTGILEILQEGYGFLRSANYMPGDDDVYVSPSQIRRFRMRTGDVGSGKTRRNNPNDKYGALLFVESLNGMMPEKAVGRKKFEDMTPIFPNERIRLEYPGASPAMRIVDLFSPIGKGQRGMIVSQPKAGKTTLLKEVAKSVKASHPDMHIIVLLIDERPEEVTDMKESIEGGNVEVIYSTFDELPEHHKRVSEMTIERAKRLVEQGEDVMILLDSITRLSRAYNLTVPPSGKTLSGGLDPTALYMPKRFFGAARNMREGGSLTILATALVNTGSKMDDVVYEEFKGTGNMELILDRKLSERRIFPAIDIAQSSTRRDDLLLSSEEHEAMEIIRRGLNSLRKDDATEQVLNMVLHTRNNSDLVHMILRKRVL